MKLNNRYKGISRIDSGSTHGWFVRGYKNGETYTKLFSDGKCGSKKKALEEAIAYRSELVNMLKEIPNKPRERRVVSSDKRNKSGVLGVCRIKRTSDTGKVTEYYSVTWRPEPGVQKYSLISISKYGEEEAFRRAVELRRTQMSKIFRETANVEGGYGAIQKRKTKKKKILSRV